MRPEEYDRSTDHLNDTCSFNSLCERVCRFADSERCIFEHFDLHDLACIERFDRRVNNGVSHAFFSNMKDRFKMMSESTYFCPLLRGEGFGGFLRHQMLKHFIIDEAPGRDTDLTSAPEPCSVGAKYGKHPGIKIERIRTGSEEE